MAEIRINATGGVKLYDADDSHYAQIVAGTITSNTDVMTLGHAAVVMGTKLDCNGNNLILDADADTYIDGGTADDTLDIYVAGAKDFTITANTLTAQSGSTIAAQALTATTVTASGIVKTDDATEATSTTDGSLQTDGGLSVVKDAVFGDDIKLLSDSSVIAFGADGDTTLTHTDGTGLTLNSTNKLCFNDATQFIQGASGTVLDIAATDEIELTATLLDVNANLDVSGTSLLPTLGVINDKDLGIGVHIKEGDSGASVDGDADHLVIEASGSAGISILTGTSGEGSIKFGDSGDNNIGIIQYLHNGNSMQFKVSAAINQILETYTRRTLFACDSWSETTAGGLISHSENYHVVDSSNVLILNREGTDGYILQFRHSNSMEGNVTSSGTTIQYNTFCGAHWGRLADNSQPTILRGTVMETIDTMIDWYRVKYTVDKGLDTEKIGRDEIALPDGKSVGDIIKHTAKSGIEYDAEIELADNEQLPMTKISDTEDSKAVYGVFSNWDNEPNDGVNDMNVASLGAFIIRVHKDETVAIGDLLSSKGDGTAKVQADDIMRSKTIAKVTSTNKTYTYDDGSYCVPCTLHCG